MISQELFDETVLENQEVFDLTPEQALQETLSQYSELDLKHLSITHPHDHSKERFERKLFVEALSKLDECIQEDGSITPSLECITWLNTIEERCKSAPYLVLLQDGMYTLMNFLSVEDNDILLATIRTLNVVLTPTEGTREVQSRLRDLMGATMEQWRKLYTRQEPKSELLQLACAACRSNEDNKKLWIKANGVESLIETLKTPQDEEILVNAARLLTVLCKFDDFRAATGVEPIVSSAHDHVLEFAQHGAVPILYKLAMSDISPTLLEATLSALRVLAIQDAIVQSMVAVGVLDLVKTTLYSQNCVGATLGLIRNLCANDEVKTTLCNEAILRGMVAAMEGGNSIVQEHACGTMAAMALRKPRNAVLIVEQHHGHLHIISAMRHQ